MTALALLLVAAMAGGNVWADLQGPGALQAGDSADRGRWTVVSVVGEARVQGGDGQWGELAPGGILSTGDVLETGAFSEVVLQARGPGSRGGPASTVALAPGSRVVLGEDSVSESRVTLGVGKLDADVRAEGRTFAFETEGSEVVASSPAGSFSVVADGEGLLGVATRRGEVSLGTGEDWVRVAPGYRAVSGPGLGRPEALPIPQEVFLEVKWPRDTLAEAQLALSGRTEPGARVRLDGREVAVGADGRFDAQVALQEGPNSLVVMAEGLGGATRRAVSPPLVYEKPPPELRLKPGGNIWE